MIHCPPLAPLLALLLHVLPLPCEIRAQGTPNPEAAPKAQGKPEPATATKLAEWPALKETDKERVLSLAGQFRKDNPKLHEEAKQQLIALGDGAMPLLLQQVSDKDEAFNAHLFSVFDEALKPAHAALMARESKKPRVELRRYLFMRMCRFVDPELVPVLKAASKDKDEPTAFYASLGMLALKEREAVPAVIAYTKTKWKEVGAITAEVLPAARSMDAGNWVFEAIAKAPPADQMAGLRLVRYLAVKEHLLIMRTYLKATDHAVKKEAVNTMRVLHGEAPIENLTVFDAIQMAEEWLKKT
ncbi:MAG TPA: hypothetical protein VFD82_07395 [Planctomycetota bacterium]|nr:hypothetical protein [Planctomycetota bacterium]